MASGSFLSVGKENFQLTDLLPYKNNAVIADGQVVVKVLDDVGRAAATFYYIDYAVSGTDDSAPDYTEDLIGWADFATDVITNVTFNAGQSFWIYAPSGYTLQGSGVVNPKDVLYSLNHGHTAVGNPFPSVMKLNQLIPYKNATLKEDGTVNGTVMADGQVVVKVLDDVGRATATYYYIDYAVSGTDPNAEGYKEDLTGWADFANDVLANPDIPIGQGFWIYVNYPGYSLYFPSCL